MTPHSTYSIPAEAFCIEDPRKARNRLAQRRLRREIPLYMTPPRALAYQSCRETSAEVKTRQT